MDIGQIREIAFVGLSCHLPVSDWACGGVTVAVGWTTYEAVVCWGSRSCRVSPPAPERWLIQVDQYDQLRGMVTELFAQFDKSVPGLFTAPSPFFEKLTAPRLMLPPAVVGPVPPV